MAFNVELCTMLGNFWNSQKQSSTTKSQSCFCPPVCTCQPFFFIGWKLVGLGADFAHTAMPETFGRVGQSISPRSALYCFLGSLANFARPSLPISNLWKEVLNIARISEAILWSRIAIYCVYIYIYMELYCYQLDCLSNFYHILWLLRMQTFWDDQISRASCS